MARRARSSKRKGRKTGKGKASKGAKKPDVQVKADTEKDVKKPSKEISGSIKGVGFNEWFR